MSLELRPAASLSLAERVELLNAGYEGYVIPMHLDEAQLTFMDNVADVDANASRIAFRDGAPIGIANLAIRGDEAWVAGVGVVTSARRGGVGRVLMDALYEEARARGVKRIWLEVIFENTAAFALYEKLGYRMVQDLEVWTLPGVEAEPAGREASVDEVRAVLPERHEPWQRADGTLAHYDDVQGWLSDTGAMLFCDRSKAAQLQQYTGDPEPLIQALRTLKDVYILNLPADDPAAAVLRDLGGTVVVRQHEMVLDL